MFDDVFFAAEIDQNISVIDLHVSATIIEALDQMHHELLQEFHRGSKYVKIVYGIGEGKLAGAVHRELSKFPMIQSVKESDAGGSCIVIF